MKMIQSESKKFVSIMAVFFAVLFGMMVNGCGGGGGGGTTTTTTAVAPGVPTNFTVVGNKGSQYLSATLTWDVPTTGSAPTSYEIYRSTTAGTVFNPDNHLISIAAVEGQISYAFIDNAGLERDVPTYWVVAAKNSSGETPTPEVMFEFTTGEVESYGNNFAAAMIFADGYGITGELIPDGSVWTKESVDPVNDIVYETGLRPSIDQTLALFPYYDPDTAFVKDGVIYYKQQTTSTWQGEWVVGTGTQEVNATWGDNLISQTLNTESIVRIEMVLTKDLVDTNMTSYNMVSLYGTKYNEIYGTDRTEYNNTKAFVYATNARLKIQKVVSLDPLVLDELPTPVDQTLFEAIPDGPGKFSSEVNVAGNFTYGFVWDVGTNGLGQGTYRITFSLDPTSPLDLNVQNNTLIKGLTMPSEGDPSTFPVLVSDTEVYIDINIGQ